MKRRAVFSGAFGLTVLALAALAGAQTTRPAGAPPAKESQWGDLLGPLFTRTPAWGWFALLGSIFAGVLLGHIAHRVMRAVAKRLSTHDGNLPAKVVENLAAPVHLVLITFGLAAGLRFLYLTPETTHFTWQLQKLLWIVAVGWALFNLVEVIELLLKKITDRTASKLDDMLVPLIRRTLRIFLVLMFSLVIAQNVFGLNITGWLAGLGIAGLAVSLAAQDSIKNLFGSITVLFDKPFAVGDRIKFGPYEGSVEEIGFRSTKIRTLSGHLATIPNMKFIDGDVENVQARRFLMRTLDVGVAYDAPLEKVEEAVRIIRDILAEPEMAEPLDLPKSPPRVFFNDLLASSLNIRVQYWFRGQDWWAYNAHAEKFNFRLLRAFNEAGIEFAFPTQTLFLADDPARDLSLNVRSFSRGGRRDQREPEHHQPSNGRGRHQAATQENVS